MTRGEGISKECGQCVSEGRASTVSAPTFGQATQIPWAPFYDKDDREKFHDHDPNRHTLTYTCSNGHQWTEDWYRECRCGWKIKSAE